jgi:hypothetical protein
MACLAAAGMAYAASPVYPPRQVAPLKKQVIQRPVATEDTTPPSIAISSPPADGERIRQLNAYFTITTSEPARICWQLDGGAQTCSSPGVTSFYANLQNLTISNHALWVTATDAKANQSTATRAWTVYW